ncbi:30S ribosomal protein S9 [bacterium]|nr:30S ribosomal protein S9 [bacterium]
MKKSKAQKKFFIGKRKTATAQVEILPKKNGKIIINKMKFEEYFPWIEWQKIIEEPLRLTNLLNKYDIFVKVKGGGKKSQAEAIRLGLARALASINLDLRKILKKAKLLTRDARIKERKKPGLKRARRAPQWSKR